MNNAKQGGAPQVPPMRGPGGRGGGGPMGARINTEKPKDMLKTLGRLLKYIGRSRLLVITLVIIMALVTVADLAGPALQGEAINTIYIDENGKIGVDFPKMVGFLGVMGILFVISAYLMRVALSKVTGK